MLDLVVWQERQARGKEAPNQSSTSLSTPSNVCTTLIVVRSKTSLLETPGGTVEIHNGEFNAVGGHHISVTINTGGDGAHSSTANSTPIVPPITGESFAQDTGPRLARRPPTPPAQRSCDIYYRHMGTQRRGSPLWIPEPNKNLRLQYQRNGVTIGDVGIITAFGSFAFLFSICLPHDHPIQPAELPENFEPFYIAQSDIEKQSEFKNDSYLASASIERTHRDGDSSGLIFESSASEGAILAMPVGSNSEDLGNVIRLRRYVAKHAASWYKYIYDVRGREVLNGDVRLIIGHDKTKAWGMATFANRTAQEDAFRLKFMPMQESNVGRTYGWEYSGMAHVRAGPDTREIEALRANDPSEDGINYENQCLFIRTLNVTLVDKVWRELASELDIQLDLDVHSSTSPSSSIQGLPGRGNLSNNSSTFTSPSYGGFPSTSKMAENIVVQATPAVHPAMAGHPSKAINEMLLKHSLASVQLVVTEDKDWISVLSHKDLVLPSAEDLCARVRASSDIVEEAGVIFLKPKGTTV
ncbi:hypothetical protein GALMADRAFT_1194831 [Galerina marginata CBS 339.88]|uniref:Uncharacterized protein n=1 Tax=Galerina marginata (strain CBS 339.88) TaxID=685588 RepID=A0A067TB65_GALM3|nr:hypothetical protein GALMADRAFT_1194831 [Galerina marginata CBS 339.88]